MAALLAAALLSSSRRYAWPLLPCDGCDQLGMDERWKCRSCSNYDLCGKCYRSVSSKHGAHKDQFHLVMPTMDTRKPSDVSEFGWTVINCDYCQTKPIRTNRFKCLECGNYDLCESCFRAGRHSHHTLAFVAIAAEKDGVAPRWSLLPAVPAHEWTNINCDHCMRFGIGVRLKCLTCDNYDLCITCFTSVGKIHPNHNFGLIYHSSMSRARPFGGVQAPAVVRSGGFAWPGVLCDGCGQLGMHDRFHCLNCRDFDYCESCYRRQAASRTHDSEHRFAFVPVPGSAGGGGSDRAIHELALLAAALSIASSSRSRSPSPARPAIRAPSPSPQAARAAEGGRGDMCVICSTRRKEMAFASCGHLALCSGECSRHYYASCPICHVENTKGLIQIR